MSDFLNKFTEKNYKETIVNKTEDKKDIDSKKRVIKSKPIEDIQVEAKVQRSEFVEESFIDPNFKKQQRNKWILLIISGLLVFSLVVFGFIWMNRVKVLDFTNKPVVELQTWAARNSITVSIDEVFSLDIDAGNIIEMVPVAGSVISKGDIVSVTVSAGADPDEVLIVPDFKDLTFMDVQNWLDQVQANNMRISYEYSDTIAADQFIRIKYNDETTTNENYQRKDYAIVYISRGPEVFNKDIEVPNWVGDKTLISTAQAWADSKSVKLNISYVYSASSVDSIVYQSVPYQSMVAKNDTITLSVSKGLSISVPDFSNLNMSDAAKEISDLNAIAYVDVQLIQMYNNTNAYGSYIWQDVNANVKIDATATKPFEMRVYYSLGKVFIESQVGSLESSLTPYFYNLNLNSAQLTYTVTYKNCTSVSDPVKGVVCYMSEYSEYVDTGTHIDIIVHDPSATATY